MSDERLTLRDRATEAADAVRVLKPRLRGWIHAGTFPLALAAGIVLVCLAPTGGRWRSTR